MEETKKTPQYNLIGAILFSIAALFGIISIISRLAHGYVTNGFAVLYTIQSAIYIGGCIVLAVSLFQKRGDILTLIGFALLTAASLLALCFDLKYGIRSLLPDLLDLAGYLGALAIALTFFTAYIPQYRDKAIKLWFVPSALIAGQVIIGFFIWIVVTIIGGGYHVGFWQTMLSAASILFACMWIVYPEGMPHKQYTESPNNADYTAAAAVPEDRGYFELAAHVLLLLFTCGIWYYIWIYRMTEYLNRIEDEPPRNPVTKLLLCLFVPFYTIYWVYKSAQRIDKLAALKGVQSDLSTLCLILAIFISILPPILMQDKINSIIRSGVNTDAGPQGDTHTADSYQMQTNVDIPEELKKYKELLDNNVITQEDYDAKKKQLLNL